MLAFVVGRATAVITLSNLGEFPGAEAFLPLRILATDHVAMAVGQHGGKCGILDPPRHQERGGDSRGVVQYVNLVAHPL